MNTKALSPKEFKALFLIRDLLLYRDKTPSLRDIAKKLGFSSPRSASLIIERLEKKGYVKRTDGGSLRLLKDIDGKLQVNRTVEIPLVGTAPCGAPFLAEENLEAMIPVSQQLARPGAKYFLLHAEGDSMNLAGINDGDLVLVRQQPVADNGQRVVALIDGEATIKEFRKKNGKVLLMPRSKNKKHQPIILNADFMIQGVIVDTLPNPIG